ncbi:alkaline phosphatase family protein [Clostridium sporogenes]|uniref:alkaline phosphatase family protein n=1 Tax=Clostridium sporogenes TaxID=1509 RepID=UPI00313F1DAA
MIFGIDALTPKLVFENLELFPNIKKLCENGMYGDYDAYAYGYGSSDNWISLYTGLTPKQHGVIGNTYKDTGRPARREDYEGEKPFWNLLNAEGIKVGMWKGLNTSPPKKINGYMISGEPNFELDWKSDPLANIKPIFCNEDKELKKFIIGDIDRPPMPKTPEDFGVTWEALLKDNSIAKTVLKKDYFHEGVEYFEKELTFYGKNIINMQKNNPVDMIFFYTPIYDFIAHFQQHDTSKEELLTAIKIVDNFIGMILSELVTENVILMSDHGIEALADNFPNTPINIQKEAFGWSDKSIWLEDGQIVTKGRNLAFLSGIHSLKGTFIISGDKIQRGKIENMRTVDFYPTILELFDIKVPENREGFVLDIFKNKVIINKDKLLNQEKIKPKNIAIIQDIEVSEFNRIINEVFLSNRFCNITIVGEEKYKNIFNANLRVNKFRIVENMRIDFRELSSYDSIYISYRNNKTKQFECLEIYNKI